MIATILIKASVTLSTRISRVDDGQRASVLRKEMTQLSQQKMQLRTQLAHATSLSVVSQGTVAQAYIGIQQPLALGGQSALALAE